MRKLTMIAMSMALLGTVSCSKGDLYDEGAIAEREAAEAAAKEAKLLEDYKADFIQTYGEVKADQPWDFAPNSVAFYTNSSAKAATRGAGTRASVWDWFSGIWDTFTGYLTPGNNQNQNVISYVEPQNGWYEIPANTRSLMNTVFKEGQDNTNNFMKGTFFEMVVPENDFYILPIYMGQSGGKFVLCMHVDGVETDQVVWRKWDNIQHKEKENSNWTDLTENNSRSGKNLVGVARIQSKPIKINVKDLPTNAKMYFYLLITKEASGYNHKDDVLGCVNGYIKEYEFKSGDLTPADLPGVNMASGDKVECKFFGCEDASTSKTDKDFNDVVFLCYGQPHVPQSSKVQDLSLVKAKRYMIEDLGLANDKDFNDVVVDVIQTFEAQIKTYDDGTPLQGFENPDYKLVSTRAEVRALGGKLNFELKIGDTTWKKSNTFKDFTQMLGTSTPDLKAEPLHVIENIIGYDYDKNNVELTVFNDGDKVARKIDFPEVGDIPLMIATPLSTPWSKEKVKFPFEEYEGSAAENAKNANE